MQKILTSHINVPSIILLWVFIENIIRDDEFTMMNVIWDNSTSRFYTYYWIYCSGSTL